MAAVVVVMSVAVLERAAAVLYTSSAGRSPARAVSTALMKPVLRVIKTTQTQQPDHALSELYRRVAGGIDPYDNVGRFRGGASVRVVLSKERQRLHLSPADSLSLQISAARDGATRP